MKDITIFNINKLLLKNGGENMSKSDDDNHANQCNPNNDAYWESRGCDERPDDWENRTKDDEDEDE